MGTVTLPVGGDFFAFNDLVGNANKLWSFDDATMEYDSDVAQATLDAALINYTANQAAIDAAFVQAETDAETLRVQDTFDGSELRILRAFAELLIDELNELRALHSLPLRTMTQLRTALRNKVSTTP
jgi:hypothetical protein